MTRLMIDWQTWMSCGSLLFAVALASCSNPADNVTPATVREPAKTPAPAGLNSNAQTAKTYTILDDSKIEFTGSKVTGSHDGGFKSFQGQFAVADGKLVPAEQTLEIDMTSTWSDSDKLTGHLKSPDFFSVEEFPASMFTITAVDPSETGATVTGNLTLHGVTKSISFPAEVLVTEDQVTLKAEFFIKRFDFDIKYPGKADDLIRDEVVIRLDVTATAD
jgi:polyisoprenoid-binding protein YceI